MNPKMICASSPRFWARVRGYKLHEMFMPYMSLNQDSVCDAKCTGCFRHPERREGLPEESLLSMAQYKELLEEFCSCGGLAIEISGEGEPLLSANTLPIIRYSDKLGIWTTLITNGHALTEEMVQELMGMKVALVLSLHSLRKEVYEGDSKVPGSYEVKMKNIDMVSEIFKGTSWSENGYLIKRAAIHWTLQADNLSEIDQAKAFSVRKGLFYSIAPLAVTGHALEHPEIWIPGNSQEVSLEKVNALGDESIIFYDMPDGRPVCGTCRFGLNIGADGNILLDAHGGYEVEIGNIKTVSFRKAVEKQHQFAQKMFDSLSHYCPVRDPGWQAFIAERKYL